MIKIIKVKLENEALAKAMGLKLGDIVDVECKGGIPKVREWRNRFRDMKIDGCISIVEDKPKKSKTPKEAE